MPNITEVCKKLQNTLKIFSVLISKQIEKKQNKTYDLKLWTDWAAAAASASAADWIHCVYGEAPLPPGNRALPPPPLKRQWQRLMVAYGDAAARCVHTLGQEIKALAITLPCPTVKKTTK